MHYAGLELDLLRLLALGCSAAFFLCIRSDPAMLVRPSFLLTLLVHARLQWPSVIQDEIVYNNLQSPGNYYLLVHGFVVASLGCVLVTGGLGLNKYSRIIWVAATRPAIEQEPTVRRLRPWLLAVCVGISAYYFSVVPFQSTGLYALVTDPTGLNEARQASLGELENPIAAYLVTWQINTFAPLLLAAATLGFIVRRRGLTLIGLASVLMAITGSRSGVALAVVVLATVYALTRWKWSRLVPAAAITLALVATSTALITLAREGQKVTRETSAAYTEDVGLGRVFTTPLKTSVLHVKFADAYGPAGIATVRPLAAWFDREFVPMPLLIGELYVPEEVGIVVNTNFLGGYYAAFGLWALVISIVGLLLLDLLLLPLSRAPDLALPLLAVLVVKAMLTSEGVLHTSLVNGGYILLPLIAWWVANLKRPVKPSGEQGRRRPGPSGSPAAGRLRIR